MTVYISNAFSLSMLTPPITVKVVEASVEDVKNILTRGFTSAVGHEATAQVITTQLSIPVSTNRISIQLKTGDTLVVFQLLTRLPEGKILGVDEMRQVPSKWYVVTVQGGE
jgi:Domain of unknown function (DUF1874).